MNRSAAVARLAATIAGALIGACNGELRFADTGDAGDAAATGPCAVDSDCPLSTLHCDAVSGVCVACITDTDCAADGGAPRCDAALHRCVACGADGDCATGEACEPRTRRCVPRCAEGPEEHECPTWAPTCDEIRGFCMSCTSNADCTTSTTDDGHLCDTENGKCVYCVADSDCSHDKPRCDRTRGRCTQCLTTSDCRVPSSCNPDTGECVLQ